MNKSTRMNLALGLPLRNQDGLEALLKEIVDPGSRNFRRYLTPEQFTERFGPTEADYQALAAYMESQGLKVTGAHPNRMILDVGGAVKDIERTFQVNMVRWQHSQRGEFFAPDREPVLPMGLTMLDIAGLDNYVIPRPMDLKSLPLSQAMPLTTGSGPAGLFIGNDYRAAYAPNVTLTGAGQSVGLFELDGFYANDVQSNFKQAGLPVVPVKTVLLDGFTGTPGSGQVEVILDIMMAAYMAPGASVIVYEGSNWNDVLNRMATDNLAKQLSCSWVFSPTNATTEQIFKQMIAQGQSLFQASGDSGAYNGWIMPPADDPNVTVVGGTSLTTAGKGGAWQSETTWSGSGGGVSTTWPIPSYQQTVNVAAVGGSTTMRNIPDVAMLADIQIFLIEGNGQSIMVGGTSAAAPLWAGFTALANQQAIAAGKPAIGFMNPLLYKIGGEAIYNTDLHDIVTGGDGYNAAPGYDLATGWGTPNGQGLINDLTGSTSKPSFALSTSTSTATVAPGASGTTTVTISPQSGFNSAVNLNVTGLPAGVTAQFSPASATTSSVLTLTASSSAAPGTSTLTITGTSGSLTNSIRLALTIGGQQGFTLAAKTATLSIAKGASGTVQITVTPQGGFSGTVALAASGLPTGVTASFSPASTTTSSTLTLQATSSASAASSTVTIAGTSGSLKATTTVSLSVTNPATFTLTASPATLSLASGGTASSAVTVAAQNGFNAAVTLAASGLPTGVTATFSPASATSASTVTFTASASAASGTSTVTITGTSGSLSSKATIALTVSQPSFTLSVSPAALSLTPGGSGSSAITITGQNGFKSAVNVALAGLPAGVTASMNSSGVLTFAAGTGVTAGTSTVTVTGTSGSITSKASIALTITVPGFTMATSPATVSLTPGGTGASTVAITGQKGFTGTVALTASGLPTGVSAAFSPASATTQSTVTFTAGNTAAAGMSTVTITGKSGSVTQTAVVALTVTAPAFAIAATPAAVSLTPGGTGASTVAITAQKGFSGTVALTASGLPTGVTAAFSPAGATTQSGVTFTASSGAALGISTVTISGKSGTTTQTATIALTVAAASVPKAVGLGSVYNITGTVTDGSKFSGGGLDSGGRAYSSSFLPTSTVAGGTTFTLGAANSPNAVSNTTIPLTAGKYSTLKLLASGINGGQPSQTFVVTYTDGTSTTFTQSMSDWCTPQNYSGETKAVPMTYRNNSDGTRDTRQLYLYGYSFNLASGKTVSAVTLPKNRNVVVLAVSLVP